MAPVVPAAAWGPRREGIQLGHFSRNLQGHVLPGGAVFWEDAPRLLLEMKTLPVLGCSHTHLLDSHLSCGFRVSASLASQRPGHLNKSPNPAGVREGSHGGSDQGLTRAHPVFPLRARGTWGHHPPDLCGFCMQTRLRHSPCATALSPHCPWASASAGGVSWPGLWDARRGGGRARVPPLLFPQNQHSFSKCFL